MSIYRSTDGRVAVRGWCEEQLDGWALTHERRTVSAGGVPTHVVTAGDGPSTVLLLPGTDFPAAACGPVVTALAGRCRVLVPDVPGQPGLSSDRRAVRRGRLDWYGIWLTDLLDTCTDRPLTVVGWSMGAAVALSSRSPLIDRLVLVSPGGIVGLRTPPRVLAASIGWVTGRRRVDSERLLSVMHGPGHRPRPELVDWMTLVARHVRTTTDPGVARVAVRDRRHVAVVGDRDVFLPVPRLRTALHRTLGIEPTVVRGAGHLLAEEEPDLVAAVAVPP